MSSTYQACEVLFSPPRCSTTVRNRGVNIVLRLRRSFASPEICVARVERGTREISIAHNERGEVLGIEVYTTLKL